MLNDPVTRERGYIILVRTGAQTLPEMSPDMPEEHRPDSAVAGERFSWGEQDHLTKTGIQEAELPWWTSVSSRHLPSLHQVPPDGGLTLDVVCPDPRDNPTSFLQSTHVRGLGGRSVGTVPAVLLAAFLSHREVALDHPVHDHWGMQEGEVMGS